MKILLVEPEKAPERIEISGDLESMQEIVGGSIQAIYPFDEPIALICNEEGKLNGLPLNRALRDEDGTIYDVITGTFFLCGAPPEEESFTSLTENQLEDLEIRFQTPELFLRLNGRLVTMPLLSSTPDQI